MLTNLLLKELWTRHHEATEMVFRELSCRPRNSEFFDGKRLQRIRERPLLIPASQVRILPGTPNYMRNHKGFRVFTVATADGDFYFVCRSQTGIINILLNLKKLLLRARDYSQVTGQNP